MQELPDGYAFTITVTGKEPFSLYSDRSLEGAWLDATSAAASLLGQGVDNE